MAAHPHQGAPDRQIAEAQAQVHSAPDRALQLRRQEAGGPGLVATRHARGAMGRNGGLRRKARRAGHALYGRRGAAREDSAAAPGPLGDRDRPDRQRKRARGRLEGRFPDGRRVTRRADLRPGRRPPAAGGDRLPGPAGRWMARQMDGPAGAARLRAGRHGDGAVPAHRRQRPDHRASRSRGDEFVRLGLERRSGSSSTPTRATGESRTRRTASTSFMCGIYG
jgi:hypothetical protein